MSRRRPSAPSAPSRTVASSAAPWQSAAIVALAAVLPYLNAVGHPFVMDDGGTVLENATIRSIGAAVYGGPAQSATAGRPLVNLSFALNYLAGGVSPWGYQAVNLALHLACALVVLLVLRRVFRLPLAVDTLGTAGPGLATATAVLWAAHPLNSEVVDYVTQRTESLAALCVLLTCYGGLRALDDARPGRWRALAVFAALAGVLCKESAVVAPLLLLLLESAGTRRSPIDVVRSRAGFYSALFGTWLVLGGLVAGGPRWRSAGFSSGVSPWTYAVNQGPMIVRYLRLVILPAGLVVDYGLPGARTLGSALPPAAVVLALLAGTVAAFRVAPLFAVFGGWFFLTLAPTSSILPIATEVGAERRMYLPLVAVLAVVLLLLWRIVQRVSIPPRVATGGVAGVCLVLAALTWNRNAEYQDTLGLWRSVVERWPSARGHYNYGIALKAAGRRTDAVAEYAAAVSAGLPEAEYALGFELQADHRYDEALSHYRAFIAARPLDINVPRAYHQIGRALLEQGKRDDAVAAFREALARNAADIDSLAGIGDTLMAEERYADAIPVWQQYTRLKPEATPAWMNLGMALVRVDRDAEARDVFAAVAQREPGNVAAHVNLAYALANTNRYGDSLKEFRVALDLERDPAGRAEIEQAIATLLGSH